MVDGRTDRRLERPVLRTPDFKDHPFFPSPLPGAFVPPSVVPPRPARHSFIHAPPFTLARFIHSPPSRHSFSELAPTWHPALRAGPAPPECAPVGRCGGSRGISRGCAGPGLAGSRAGGGGRALPAGSQAGWGSPGRAGSRRARPWWRGRGPGAAGASGGCPAAMWTGGRRPGRLRRAVSTCEPGGRGGDTRALAGRGYPRRGAVSAQRPRRPGPGRRSSLSSPPRGAPCGVGAPGPRQARFPGREERAGAPRSGALQGRGRDRPRRCRTPRAAGPGAWAPIAGALHRTARIPAPGARVGPGAGLRPEHLGPAAV